MQPANAVDTDCPSPVPVFNRTKTWKIQVPHPDFPDGKWCRVKFPTDEQLSRRVRTRLHLSRSLGRDMVKSETRGVDESNIEMFNAIRVGADQDGFNADFDPAETAFILNQILRCDVLDVSREGNVFIVTLDVPGDVTVTHRLRQPSQKQFQEYSDSASQSYQRRTGGETRYLLEPSGKLWDVLDPHVTGYPTNDPMDVPIIHKDTALGELISQVQATVKTGPVPED